MTEKRPAAIALECIPMINDILDQVRDTGDEWDTIVFETVQSSLSTHKAAVQKLLQSIRERPLGGLFSPKKSLRDDAADLVEGVILTATAAATSSAAIQRARIMAGMSEPEFPMTGTTIGNDSWSDFTAQKLADELEKIHIRMKDIFPLVLKARRLLSAIRSNHSPPPSISPARPLFVTNPGNESEIGGSSSGTPSSQVQRTEFDNNPPSDAGSGSFVFTGSSGSLANTSFDGILDSWHSAAATHGTDAP